MVYQGNHPKILLNNLDQAPKTGLAYEQRLSAMSSEVEKAFTEGERKYYESRIEKNKDHIVSFISHNFVDESLKGGVMNRGDESCYQYHNFENVDDWSNSDDLVHERGCLFTGRYHMTDEYERLFTQDSQLYVDLYTHNRADLCFQTVLRDGNEKQDILDRFHNKSKLYTALKDILGNDLKFEGTREEVKNKKKELDAIISEIDAEDKAASLSLLK